VAGGHLETGQASPDPALGNTGPPVSVWVVCVVHEDELWRVDTRENIGFALRPKA
jgi:hypothetical protein